MNDLYTRLLKRFHGCHDQRFSIPDHFGNGYCRSVCPCRGILLLLEEYRLKREMPMEAEGLPPSIGFSYCISGRIEWSVNGVEKPFVTRRGQCELMATSISSVGRTRYDADEPLIILNIMLFPELIKRYFDVPVNDLLLSETLHPIETDNGVRYRKRAITNVERQIVRGLFHAPCGRPAERLLMLSKVLELAAFQLDLADTPVKKSGSVRNPDADMALVSRAQSILKSSIQAPPSLKCLARMLGTNETKLKKSFTACCDTTVYGYLTACRMQRACELLGNDNLTLSQIGAELGYSERPHFTRAFTRHFGMPPSRYRCRRCYSK